MQPIQLRMGDLVVDFSSREAYRAGRRVARRIGIKPLEVLRVLADAEGKVVSRDTLLDVVWRGRCPTPDVVTQAIKALRQALGDDASEPTIIETIARSGYRLLVPATWLGEDGPSTDEALSVQDAPGAEPRVGMVAHRKRRAGTGVALAAVVLAAAASGIGLKWIPPAHLASVTQAPTSVTQIDGAERLTSGVEREWQPRLSPDENRIAYVKTREDGTEAIHVQELSPGESRQLTFPGQSERDSQPLWSPDGSDLVFQRTRDRTCALMIVSVEGGTPRRLGACRDIGAEIDWSPDGRHLVSGGPADTAFPSLHVFSLATRAWAPLAYDVGDGMADVSPRYSPDGKWIAFLRGVPGGDVWRVPASGGNAVQLTRRGVEVRGLDWMPDSQGLLASTFFGEDGNPRLARVDPAGAVARIGPMASGRLDVGARHGRIAFEYLDVQTRALAWRPATAAAPVALFPSSGGEVLPSASPDGETVAYQSDRSGQLALWFGDRDASSPRIVQDLVPENRFPPQWSNDGLRVLVAGRSSQGTGIHEVDAASGRHRLLAFPGQAHRFATYGADSRAYLVLAADREGRQQLDVFPAGSVGDGPVASLPDVSYAQWDAVGGRVLFTRQSQAGLWTADERLRGGKRIDAAPDLANYRFWAVSSGEIWIGRPVDGGAGAVLERMVDGASHRYPGSGGLFPILSASGDTLYLTQFAQNGIDIGLANPATN